MERVRRHWLQIVIGYFFLSIVATIYVENSKSGDPRQVAMTLLLGIPSLIGGALGIWSVREKLWPGLASPKTEAISEDFYLEGRRNYLADQEHWFITLAGEEIELQFERRDADFSPQIPSRPLGELAAISLATKEYRQFILVGAPGSGKTTALQQLFKTAIEAYKNGDGRRVLFPLWVDLGDSNNPVDVDDLLRYWWHSRWHIQHDPQTYVNNNRLQLFLDGLNEMPEEGDRRTKLAASLKTWLKKYDKVPAIITCRTNDYTEELNLELPVVRIQSLDEQKIEQFIRKPQNTRQLAGGMNAE